MLLQLQSLLEESNCDISVPISEIIVVAESLSMPGMVQRSFIAAAYGSVRDSNFVSRRSIAKSRYSL